MMWYVRGNRTPFCGFFWETRRRPCGLVGMGGKVWCDKDGDSTMGGGLDSMTYQVPSLLHTVFHLDKGWCIASRDDLPDNNNSQSRHFWL